MPQEMNITEVLIGCQGSGKSWHGMNRAAEIGAEWDCPIIIHDSGSSAIRKPENPFHDNAEWYLTTSDNPNPNEIKARLKMGTDIFVVNTANAEDALTYADIVAPDSECVILVDEVTASKAIKPSGVQEPWATLIAQRRAKKRALIFCMQTPTMASRYMTSLATSVKCFRVEHKNNLKAAALIGYTDEQVSEIEKLPRGKYIERSQGFGT